MTDRHGSTNGEGRCNGAALRVDTIVALATPEGEAGLAAIRISGPEATALAGRLFDGGVDSTWPRSHHAVHGILRHPASGEALDEVVVLPMLAPRSYTGEDVVEIFCHGGRVVSRRIVAACVDAGARPAGPGEFTRRAFLNGKLDLEQAEGVADLIHAEQDLAASAALRQVRGGLREELLALEAPLLELLTRLEGCLEFADDEEISVGARETAAGIEAATAAIDGMLELVPACRQLRKGVQVALVGAPNVGKSSLVNVLAGRDAAIVDAEAGTTRDVVRASADRAGLRYVFLDTAGLRDGGGTVEAEGMRRTLATAAEADLVLVLTAVGDDGSIEEKWTPPAELSKRCNIVDVLTKADLAEGEILLEGFTVVTSALTGSGLDELWNIIEASGREGSAADVAARGVFLNARHQHRLLEAKRRLADIPLDAGDEVTATLLGTALAALGEISGRVYSEKILGEVFGRFCVGK